MENPILIIAVFAACLVAFQFFTKDKRKLKAIRREWETGWFLSGTEDLRSVASYWRNKTEHAVFYAGVDQITWDDLAMDEVFKKMNYTKTSVGSEFLFNQLRDIDPKLCPLQPKEELYTLLAGDHKLREKVLLVLSGLGKRDYANSSSYFYPFTEQRLNFPYIYTILSCLPVMSIGLMVFSLKAGLFAFLGTFIINIAVYYRNKNKLENDLRSIAYVAAIINTGKSLAAIPHPRFSALRDLLKSDGKELKKVSFFGKVLSIGSSTGGDFDILFEYIRIVFLLDFISYNQIVKALAVRHSAYKQVWEAIGELDAAIAVAFYRKSLSEFAHPSFTDQEELAFEEMVHPLLEHPVANSAVLGKSILITGSNASGKSTFIKAVAINSILAQTINTATAKNWTMKPSFVVTSMAIQDSVLDGDSYFIAEIKSLKRIIKLIELEQPVISFIDEILKGTNTIERISASAAIMEWQSVRNGMNIIASHDIELTEIAGAAYTNYHFRESVESGEVRFDYEIHDGPSQTRNAIKLLEILDYPETVTAQANQLAQHFAGNGEWKAMESANS